MTYNPVALRDAVNGIPEGAWSLPSTFAETKVHHGYSRVQLITNGVELAPPYVELFRFVLDDFEPVDKAWLSRIDPGGYIIPHADAAPWKERWHVPIQAAGLFNGNHGSERPVDAVPFRVEHWVKHSVENDTEHPRIHLVVDRDVAAGPAQAAKFQTYPKE